MNGFGIDFGTTNSVAAVCDGRTGKVRALTDITNNRPHPSVVWYKGDQTIVGSAAKYNLKDLASVAGNAFVPSVKRKLGSDHEFSIFGEKKMAWEVAADIFRFLKERAATEYRQELDNIVVTVPVNYDGRARSELRKAASAAGLRVTTFIHEPFAAVIGYCGNMPGGIQHFDGSHVMVFDWGGGTLDITIARIKDSRVYELSTSGLRDIAGDYFDSRLENFGRTRFLDKHALHDEKVALLPGTRARFAAECERAKINLSSADEEQLLLAQYFEREGVTYDLNETVMRSDFERIIRDDIDAALRQVDKALDEAALSAQEIDTVLLIGGTSKIPLLKQMMINRFGPRTIDVPNGDTVIAEGASIIAKNGWMPYLVRPIQIRLSDESLYTVFEEGCVLKPEACRRTVNFYCTDNRDGEARMVLVEQQRSGDTSSSQVKHVLNIPVNPTLSRAVAGERVTAQFEIDDDLEFHVSAWGNIDEKVTEGAIHDLCFGIRVD
jgi:molecular chaperone DnaK